MGCLGSTQFKAQFSANLHELFDYYLKNVLSIKTQQLFLARSPRLQTAVDTYLENPRAFDTNNPQLCAVDIAHKLHPVDYGTSKATREWLIQACLRQHKFISEFPFEKLNFDNSYKEYVEFLYTYANNSNMVIVPNKLADFMWHSHMQDNRRYKADSQKMLGRVLDHLDDLSQAQMQQYARYTEQYRKKVFLRQSGHTNQNKVQSHAHQYQFINYGQPQYHVSGYPQNNPIDQRLSQHHHHQHLGHHHQKHHANDDCEERNHHCEGSNNHHHPTAVQSSHYHHHDPVAVDTHHHSSCGEGGHHTAAETAHSQCGGGGHHSSCGGGGHSSCGGGHSSCGGAASSCGGGASSCGGGGCGGD